MVTTDAIAIENGCGCEVAPALSFRVTLKVKGLPSALVGVPLIAPVDAFSIKPGGSPPALTDQLLYGGVPPLAVKVAEYGVPTMPDGGFPVMVSCGAAIVMENGCGVEVAPRLSFTVTLKLNLPAVVGVPPITPLDGSSARPPGSAPEAVQLP